jgi:hypothetical protein
MEPQDEVDRRTDPEQAPLEGDGAARHLEHLGMNADAARTFAAYHSGLYRHGSAFRDAA